MEPWRFNNTVEQLLKDSEVGGRSIKEVLCSVFCPSKVLCAMNELRKLAHIFFELSNIIAKARLGVLQFICCFLKLQ
jgi:hypothetical protein